MPKYPIILGQVTKYVTISFRVCVWGDFFLSVSVFHQIARYLLHHRSGNASKTHPKHRTMNSKRFLRIMTTLFLCQRLYNTL